MNTMMAMVEMAIYPPLQLKDTTRDETKFEKFKKTGKILDVGCGDGILME